MEKSQSERVLEVLLRDGKITSLQMNKMYILNFHQIIKVLRQFHDIETKEELVKKWFSKKLVKHTTYIYKGRRVLPERMCKCKKYTQEEVDVLVKQAEEKGYNDGYENAKFQYTN